MVKPTGRTTNTIPDPKDTMSCDSDKPGQVSSFKAGEEIDVVWTRNNHLGGFIQFAMVPKNAVSKENFDNNVFYYTYREANCDLKHCNEKYCGDDGGAGNNGIKCSHKIKLPDYLDAGDYVLQWLWHSAGSSYGNIGWSTGNYKTCADIKLTTKGMGTRPKCPTFAGGDRVTKNFEKIFTEEQKNNQCLYFDDNDVTKILIEYGKEKGLKRYLYGVPKQIQTCGGNPSPAPSPKPTEIPSPKPTQAPTPKPTEVPSQKPTDTLIPTPTSNNPDQNGGKTGQYVYIGPGASEPKIAEGLNQWCNWNCPNFCPDDFCRRS